nr:hypothetical protein [Actinoplanes capillaceus]
MQPRDDLGAGAAELVAAVNEQPQCHGGVVDGDAVGIDRVGLAALAGGEHPGAGGQFRRDVKDGLAVGDQALGDVPADTVAARDRPDPVTRWSALGRAGRQGR